MIVSIGKDTKERKVNKKDLNIDYTYQRPPIKTKIREFKNNWDNIAAGSITVGERKDGSLWIVDGQHRYMASLEREDVESLKCNVFSSSGQAEEALYFLKLNKNRKMPSALQQFNAGLVAKDPRCLKIEEISRTNGVLVRQHNKSETSVVCRCAYVMGKIMDRYGEDVLDTTLRLLKSIHPLGTSIDYAELWSVSYILKFYTIPNMEKFEKAFLKVTPARLSMAARSDKVYYSGYSSERIMAIGAAREINSHMRSGKIFQQEQE